MKKAKYDGSKLEVAKRVNLGYTLFLTGQIGKHKKIFKMKTVQTSQKSLKVYLHWNNLINFFMSKIRFPCNNIAFLILFLNVNSLWSPWKELTKKQLCGHSDPTRPVLTQYRTLRYKHQYVVPLMLSLDLPCLTESALCILFVVSRKFDWWTSSFGLQSHSPEVTMLGPEQRERGSFCSQYITFFNWKTEVISICIWHFYGVGHI